MQPLPPSLKLAPGSPDATPVANDFWPGCGYTDLQTTDQGELQPTAAWWRRFLARPELAPVPESCAAERALHAALQADPLRSVPATELAHVQDADARENLQVFLAFRDRLQAAGSIEAGYRGLFGAAGVTVPPLFVDLLAQVITRHLLEGEADAWLARAGELLFRTQRVNPADGQMLAGDRDELDMLNETGGFGELGRLLAQANAPRRQAQLQVLGPDTAVDYWRAAQAGGRWGFLLDLRLTTPQALAHGLQVSLQRVQSGPRALAVVLQRWVRHLLGVAVTIEAVPRIEDTQWRWHIGLDAEASALLNDLYEDRVVEPERLARMLMLFRLRFDHPDCMRADLGGCPVYLGVAMTADGLLRLKPQNLLLNLPLARGH